MKKIFEEQDYSNLEIDIEGVYRAQLTNRYRISFFIGDLFDRDEVAKKALEYLEQLI